MYNSILAKAAGLPHLGLSQNSVVNVDPVFRERKQFGLFTYTVSFPYELRCRVNSHNMTMEKGISLFLGYERSGGWSREVIQDYLMLRSGPWDGSERRWSEKVGSLEWSKLGQGESLLFDELDSRKPSKSLRTRTITVV